MGAAVSNNVSNAIATVVNEIQNEASASANQGQECKFLFDNDNCTFFQGLEINNVCNAYATSKQVVQSRNESNLNSDIAQKLQQRAQSTVGSMGIGYAEANNVANNFINSSNSIVNVTTASANQIQNTIFAWHCRGGKFFGPVQIGVEVSGDFLSDQVVKQQETSTIVSNIVQDISQTATAEVQGLAGFLLALAVLIVAIGWVIFRPLQLALNNRILMIFLIVMVIVILGVAGYIFKWPPFFNEPTVCVAKSNIQSCSAGVDCVDVETRTIDMTQPPLRYSLGIVGGGDVTLGESPRDFTPGLLQMAISKNKGWTESAFIYFRDSPIYKKIPHNPLILSGNNTYITNRAFISYVNSSPENALLARYVLARDLNIDTFMYIYDTELCYVNNVEVAAGSPGTYKYVPNNIPPSLANPVVGGGTMTGMFGYCDSPTYKIQKVMRTGGWIGLGILIMAIIAFIFFYSRRTGTATNGRPSSARASTGASETK